MRRRRYFDPDEEVVYAARPHPVVLVRPLFACGIVLAGCSAGFLSWTSAPAWFGVLLGVLAFGAASALARRTLRFRSTLLLITSRRVVTRRGVLGRSGRELAASRVADVAFSQTPLGRLFGYGELAIEVSGDGAAMALSHVRRPEAAEHALHRAAESAQLALRRAAAPPQRPAVERADLAGGPAAHVPDALLADDEEVPVAHKLELLETMWRRGMVSESEFAEKRAELLRGA